MLYKPKYCCQCGEDIERVAWKLWSSRRFCQLCETEVGHHDWIPRMALGVGIFLSVFGLGSYLQTPDKSFDKTPRQIVSQSNLDKNIARKKSDTQVNKNEQTLDENLDTTSNVVSPTKQNDVVAEKNKIRERQTTHLEKPQNNESEPVYFCGAETKKGTPCSRRVKGGGRCWQHKGREAMLPEKELLVNH